MACGGELENEDTIYWINEKAFTTLKSPPPPPSLLPLEDAEIGWSVHFGVEGGWFIEKKTSLLEGISLIFDSRPISKTLHLIYGDLLQEVIKQFTANLARPE